MNEKKKKKKRGKRERDRAYNTRMFLGQRD